MSNIKADNITNAAGTGAPDFTQGIKLKGSVEQFKWYDYTPTTEGWTGVTVQVCRFMVMGEMLHIQGRLDHTGVDANNATISLPAGYTHSVPSQMAIAGILATSYSGADQAGMTPVLVPAETGKIYFGTNTSANGAAAINGNQVSSASGSVHFAAFIDIT